jgi:exopolyphosphatase/pppGpp-phosphohydrolase
MKKYIILLLSFIMSVTYNINAQDIKVPAKSTLAMYVEYGGKGVKFGLLAYTDAKFRKYIPLENTELNIGLSKSIQSTGNITPTDISSAVASSYDAYNTLLAKYKPLGLKEENIFFYTSSGLAAAKNVQDLCTAVKAKIGKNVYVVNDVEEAKYTIAGTVPFEKIDVAMVLDQGGSNTKGGYVTKDGNLLTAVPTNFDLGSVRVSDLIVTNFMKSHPDNKSEELKEYIAATERCFDSLKIPIKRTFSNIESAEFRNELYLSGGAAYAVTTLLLPNEPLDQQLIEIKLEKLKAFYLDIQDRDYYTKLRNAQFSDEKVSKNYTNALKIYNQMQLISATKLLITYITALGGDEKKIYFNRYGLHAMPSMLIGRVLRGDIQRW